jgi:hypothetical protein
MLGDTPADSLADAEEKELVRHLIHDWHWGSAVMSMFDCVPGSKFLPEVPLASLGNSGDLDLLCASPSTSNEAVAVQFKVAKVRESTYYTLQPGKFQELPKLYRQTNELVQLGFNRVFACLIVLIDGRTTPPEQPVVGGLTGELRSDIDRRITLSGLSPQAGFLRVDLVQAPQAAPLTTGEIACHLLRPPSRQAQNETLTEWVAHHVAAA